MKRLLSVLSVALLVTAALLVPLEGKPAGTDQKEQEVLTVLKKFQAGYTARDLSRVDAFMAELFDPGDCAVIGTSGYGRGLGEWFEGYGEVRKIIAHDWKNWDDLRLDVENARIRVSGNTAWILVLGTSESRKDKKKEYERTLDRIARTIELNKNDKSDGVAREILLFIASHASRYLYEYVPEGDEFLYPLRVSAVLVKKRGKWLFRLMDFSFPDRGGSIPNIRITRKEKEKMKAR